MSDIRKVRNFEILIIFLLVDIFLKLFFEKNEATNSNLNAAEKNLVMDSEREENVEQQSVENNADYNEAFDNTYLPIVVDGPNEDKSNSTSDEETIENKENVGIQIVDDVTPVGARDPSAGDVTPVWHGFLDGFVWLSSGDESDFDDTEDDTEAEVLLCPDIFPDVGTSDSSAGDVTPEISLGKRELSPSSEGTDPKRKKLDDDTPASTDSSGDEMDS